MRHIEYWIADDGKEFDNESDCVIYELSKPYLENGLPFESDCDFNGDFEKFYNDVENITITDAEAYEKFVEVMHSNFGFCEWPRNVKTGEQYYYDCSGHSGCWKKK